MFDFSKLGDLSKVADQAKKTQERQEQLQDQQVNLLKKISVQLDELISIVKKRV